MRKKFLDNNMRDRCRFDCNRSNYPFKSKKKDIIKFCRKKKENWEKCILISNSKISSKTGSNQGFENENQE